MKHLIKGDKLVPEDFKLVGRHEEMQNMFSVLMRQKASSLILIGPGGVGCSALLKGLQQSKTNPDTPYDIVAKNFYWLNVDSLFSSGETHQINEDATLMADMLARNTDNVLVVENVRGLIEGARNHGCSNIINMLLHRVKKRRFQMILEVHDSDAGLVFGLHVNIKDFFTVLEINEPKGDELRDIVVEACKGIEQHHMIRISDDAIDTAIQLTQKFSSNHPSLNRSQPECTISLIDLSMADYRRDCHEELSDADKYALNKIISMRQKSIAFLNTSQTALEHEMNAFEEDKAKNNLTIHTTELIESLKSDIGVAHRQIETSQQEYETTARKINENFILGIDHVIDEFAEKSNISASKLREDEKKKILGLAARVKQQLFDQDHVVDAVCDALKVAYAGLRDNDKPLGSFLLAGASGVGKTELVKVLSNELQGSRDSNIRIDCSEFQEKHSVAGLIGPPPGYEGFDMDAGVLTTGVRRNPHSIVLFDEVEKAHVNIFDLLLQVLDDARLTSSYGLTVKFNHTLILLTTNIGSQHFLDTSLTHEEAEARMMQDLEDKFRPEFLNRFNGRRNIHGFRTLRHDTIIKIAEREIMNVNAKIAGQNVKITMPEDQMREMVEDLYQPTSGAREIKGILSTSIHPEVAHHILNGTLKSDMNVRYDRNSRKISVE